MALPRLTIYHQTVEWKGSEQEHFSGRWEANGKEYGITVTSTDELIAAGNFDVVSHMYQLVVDKYIEWLDEKDEVT